MPKDFLACVAAGGKTRTKDLGKGRYMHLCKDAEGHWHAGEVKVKKKGTKNARGGKAK